MIEIFNVLTYNNSDCHYKIKSVIFIAFLVCCGILPILVE